MFSGIAAPNMDRVGAWIAMPLVSLVGFFVLLLLVLLLSRKRFYPFIRNLINVLFMNNIHT
jgi:hypothetical protein